MNDELIQIFKDYVATANNPKYGGNWDEINSKFPELSGYDKQLLKDYVATASNSSYGGDWNTINSKFPEFFGGVKKKDLSVSTSQEAATAPAMEAGSLVSPKSKAVETTRADGTPVRVDFGPTGFKSSDEAPVPQFKTLSEMTGQVDATIDEPTKQKISQAIGISGAIFNKIVNPNASVPEAINQAKAFADNTQAAYNVGVLSGQISNNMQATVPDKERIAKLNKELKQEQTKLMSSKMGADASNFFDMLASNPVTFLTEVLTTSAAQMTTGVGGMRPEDLAAAGLLTATTGVGGAAYMSGKNSLNAEMSSRIMSALEERNVDITDPAQLETAMTNRELMMEIAGEVQAPAAFVAALDAVSAGIAGKLRKPIYEVLAQATAGSVGEAGAQLIESGEITSASAILTEAVAELPGGLIETAFGAKTKDVQRKIKINRQLKDVEAQIELTEDEDTKSVLRSVADNLRNEKNKIYDDYASFVNSLPEEDVARLNSLNEEIVKTSNAIAQVDNAATKDALKARRSALLKQVEQLENKQQDAVQEQTTDEGVLRPEQPEVGLQEVVEGDQEPQVAAEEGIQEEVGTVGTLLNERVVYDDPVSGQPVEGDLFVEGQRLVLEAADGQQFDLGNVDEMTGQPIEGGTLRPAEMAVMPQQDGSLVFNKEGNKRVAKGTKMFNRTPGLKAIRRDSQGKVSRVVLSSEDGKETYNLTGQEAQDAAYYIMRGFVETQEGQDIINQLSERNEEARRDLAVPIPVAPAVEGPAVRAPSVQPVQQAATPAAVAVRDEVPAGADVEVDTQELADLRAEVPAASAKRVERIKSVAERARKAIARIMPDVKIIIHDTQQAYEAATSDTEQASYIGRTIHINATKATPSAVAHEVFHAVFLDRVKTDARAQEAAKRMVESLKRVLGKDSEVYQYLNEFSKNYDSNLRNEEKLAEMVAVLAEFYSGVNDIGLSTSAVQSVKNTIKKFITDVAKIFNIPMPTTLTDADVMAVLNTIAQKTVTGEVITEADVQAIDRMVSEDIGSTDVDVNQIRQRKGLITITEREAMKYARIGINDARVAQAMEDIGLAGVRFTKSDVNVAIENAFNTAIEDIQQTDMYNGQPAVITQDSPAITRAIEAEIVALEEQGASISRIESAKRMIEDKETRFRYIKNYQDAQTETLSQWTSYLSQSPYDPAFKMLMLDAVVTNNYDLSIDKYIKRDNKTIRNITPFDAGTLAELYGMTDSKELLKTYTEIQSDNAENVVKSNEVKSTKDGKWLKFNGGENTPQSEREVNAVALSQLVQDTYWCTKSNASSQLDGGDFYVYATKDKSGKYRSRIAVRMDGNNVGEVRGNASAKQDVEADMLPVAEKFLREEIPNDSGKKWLDSIEYNKKAKALAESMSDKKLSMDMIKEFGVLSGDASKYSVDYGKNGFIERIENIIRAKASTDDVTADLKGKVATRARDLGPNTRVFIGEMGYSLYEDFSVGLEVVIGDVNIGGNVGIDKVSLPPKLKSIYGNVQISGGNVDFSALENIYGGLNIGVSAESLGNIKVVSGDFYLMGNTSSLKDLGKIEVINSQYTFEIPDGVKELKYLKTVNGNLRGTGELKSLGSLENINGALLAGDGNIKSLGNLKNITGDIYAPETLLKIDGVNIVGDVNISVDTEIVNIKKINGDLRIQRRTEDETNKLPKIDSVEEVTGSLSISGDIKTLGNLRRVGGRLFIGSNNLETFGNLEYVGGDLSTLSDSLKSFGNLKYVGEDLKVFSNVIEDLGSLEYVGGDFSSLSFGNAPVSSLGKLKYVGGNIGVRAFTQLKDLGSLEYVGGLFSINAPLLKDLGSLNSVGKGYFQKTYGDPTKRNILSEVNESPLPALASRYISDSDIYPGDVNDIIKDNIFNLALKQAAEHFSIDTAPAPRQRKDSGIAYENWKNGPKSGAQAIGYKYNMNFNGYTPSNIVKQHFKNDVERLSKRLSIRSTITGSGYYMTLDGKFFNPYLKVIGGQDGGANGLRQRMGQPNENIFDIVTMARQKGYTDNTITAYLREEGFAPNDIIDALKVNSNIEGTQVPQEFGNVTGGMAQGQNLFDDIKAKLAKMAIDGATMAEVRIEAQTLLTESDVYKAQSEEVKAQLRLSLDAAIGTKAADRAFRQEFKELRAMLADRKKARRELETIKRMMRGFIRKNLPQGEYSKAEVVRLLKAIVDANIDTLPVVMERVEGYVTEFKVRKLQSDLKKILATKTTRVESGRQMGSMTIEMQEDLAELNEALVDEGMSPQQMSSTLSAQLSEYDALESSYDMTDKEARRMQILEISMMYNEAMILEDNDPNKVDSLASARDQLVAMIAMSRADFKAIKAAQSASYKQSVRDMVEAITGEAVPDDIDTKDGLNEFVRKSEVTTANKEAARSRIVKAWNSFFGKPVTQYFDRTGSLHTLLGRITANITDQFGGRVNEMVYDRLKLASIEFERRMQILNNSLDAKGREIFGKDYDNVVKNNRVKKPIDIFTDKSKAQRLMNEMKTASSQRKSEINNELNELRVFEPMSQNQIYYLYNQFKDPANRSGFEAKFGEGYVNNLNELFETSLDPSVKEWADWQVLEFYPSVYETYNDVYKKIFRTNMPWNPNYAGRLYRERESEDNMAITLLDGQGQFSNIQTPSSTKMRKANSNPVKIMDGDMVLTSYLGDMEYFRAYGETIRDVDKLFRNKAVQESIKKTSGEDILGLIKDYIKIVGTRGTSLGVSAKQTTLDNTASRFSRAVLMANPSQLIKQATSLFAFANRIGFEKWVAYTAKAAPQMSSLWSEFMDNAPRIQKRYNPRELTAIIGTYKPGRTSELMPKDKNGSPILRKAGEVYDKALDALMWPVIKGDKFSAMAGAMGNYLYYKETFMQNNPSATEEQAIKFAADKVSTEIEQTLGSADVIDKDFYQNSGNALYRAFSVLQNSPKAMIRQLVPAYSGLFKKISKMDKAAGAGTLKQNIETVLLFQFFVPMLFQYAVLGLPGLLREWRDDDDEEMGMAALLGPFTALFFIGDVLSMSRDIILDKPWATDARTAPGWDILSGAGKSVDKLMKADSDDKVVEALSEIGYSLSAAAGLGLKNISRMAKNIAEVVDDGLGSGESILRLFNYSDYTIEGPDREK